MEKLDGTSEGLLKVASRCDWVAQGLVQASFANLQVWRLHVLSRQAIPVHEIIDFLPHILKKHSNNQLLLFTYKPVSALFSSLTEKRNERDAYNSNHDTMSVKV